MEADPSRINQRQENEIIFFDPSYSLRSPERTLGHSAVAQANIHAAMIEQMSAHDQGSSSYRMLESIGNARLDDAHNELKDVRETLGGIEAKAEAMMTQYLDVVAPEHALYLLGRHPESTGPALEWKDWMTSEATDAELLNVLQWHNRTVEQQATSRYLGFALDIHKHQFINVADKLYEAKAFGLPPKNIDEINLVIGDVFDTLAKERAGYYLPGRPEVVVMQGQEPTAHWRDVAVQRSFNQILTHEFVHALLCRSREIQGSPLSARWINEAQTEVTSRYIRRVNQYPVPEDGVYHAERVLRKSLLSASSNVPESERLLMRAFTGTERDGMIFSSHIDEMWDTHDVINKVSRAVTLQERQLARSGSERGVAVQTAAVRRVNEQLRADPDAVLRRSSGGHVYDNEAAQQPKK